MTKKFSSDHCIGRQSRLIVLITEGFKYSKVSKISPNGCWRISPLNPSNAAMQHLKGVLNSKRISSLHKKWLDKAGGWGWKNRVNTKPNHPKRQ